MPLQLGGFRLEVMRFLERTFILFAASILIATRCLSQTVETNEHVVSSPDGKHAIGFRLVNGTAFYHVSYEGAPILSESQLSLSLESEELAREFEIVGTQANSQSSRWVPVVGSMRSYPDSYNERVIQLHERTGLQRRLHLVFRAYNEGVAFRYVIPEQAAVGRLTLHSENSEFRFTDDHFVFWDDYPQAKYSKVRLSEMEDNSMRPLLLETRSHFIAIAEAGSLERYAPMKLNRIGKNGLITRFRRGIVRVSDQLETPWRVIMVADQPGRLVENHYLLQNLSDPCALEDTSWIKPGKVWRSRLDTASAKAIVDYASANSYQYVHYDAGWYGPERDEGSNPTTYIDDIDLPDVVQYASDRGIGLICYINKIAMSRYDLDRTFRTYQEWGIRGVKFGFVDWQSQSDMEFLYSAIRKAAKYKLIVDIHDNFRLTGIERSYPNVLTVEGILGNEERANRGNPPQNVLTTSFARMIAGAGDFTPCYLNGRVVSRAFQLALGVVFYSPLQYLHWYDQMDQYEGNAFPELEFWKEMPTTWDDSKVVQGVIGKYMTVARRKGDAWFVGTIVDEAVRLEIPLSFLGEGTFTARVYKEDPNEKRNVLIEAQEVDSSVVLNAHMSAGSGHAVWLVPVGTR